MAVSLPPLPLRDLANLPYVLQEWLRKIQTILTSGGLSWSLLDFTGSNLTDIQTRNHNDLQSIQGGTTGEYYHLTSARNTTLTGNQPAGTVFAGPSTGADAPADFRFLTSSDIPVTGNELVTTSIQSGNIFTIPTGKQLVLAYNFSILGTGRLEVQGTGKLVVL